MQRQETLPMLHELGMEKLQAAGVCTRLECAASAPGASLRMEA